MYLFRHIEIKMDRLKQYKKKINQKAKVTRKYKYIFKKYLSPKSNIYGEFFSQIISDNHEEQPKSLNPYFNFESFLEFRISTQFFECCWLG